MPKKSKTPGKGKKKGGKRKKGKNSRKAKLTKIIVDIMSAVAMVNLYYIAHNAPTALVFRGFKWGAQTKKKGGGGGGKGKKRKKKK